MQEIEAYLSIYCISNPLTGPMQSEHWIIRTQQSTSMLDKKHTPFELMMGYQPPGFPGTTPTFELPRSSGTNGTSCQMEKGRSRCSQNCYGTNEETDRPSTSHVPRGTESMAGHPELSDDLQQKDPTKT